MVDSSVLTWNTSKVDGSTTTTITTVSWVGRVVWAQWVGLTFYVVTPNSCEVELGCTNNFLVAIMFAWQSMCDATQGVFVF
jgi:hypothetical protein